MLYLDVWISICDLLFYRWYQRAASAIGFVHLASSGCDIDPIVNDFSMLRIIEWLAW